MVVDVTLTSCRTIGRYDVRLADELIVEGSRDPEYDAARALRARGLTGPFQTIDGKTGKLRMRFPSIAAAAELMTSDPPGGGGPRVVRWKPFSREAVEGRTRFPDREAPEYRPAVQGLPDHDIRPEIIQ